MRRLSQSQKRNIVTGRWVLIVKRYGQSNFFKCNARWVLRGFQEKQIWDQQIDSPAASWLGFHMACRLAVFSNWDLTHMDIKTAFLQGDRYDDTRNSVCALPRKAGHPPHMATRMKTPENCPNDDPRRGFNVVDASLRGFGCVPTRGARCTDVLYSMTHLAGKRRPVKQSTK